MNILIGRQLVIGRNAQIFAYELLYRDIEVSPFVPLQDFDLTEQLIRRNGLESRIMDITNGKRALINFSEQALLNGLAKQLPPQEVIIEILETVSPSDEVFKVCCELISLGYELALDDFIYSAEWERFLEIVMIVKIDIIETPLDSIGDLVERIYKIKQPVHGRRPLLLAEKIETADEYEKAKDMGFDYYQGFLFGRPEIISYIDEKLMKA
jgi:EAL and modified HD-GYP domain-containing signal transduction protein